MLAQLTSCGLKQMRLTLAATSFNSSSNLQYRHARHYALLEHTADTSRLSADQDVRTRHNKACLFCACNTTGALHTSNGPVTHLCASSGVSFTSLSIVYAMSSDPGK